MNRVMLLYPPGKMYQRSEDRAQCNIDDSATATVHACNDLGYAASVLRNEGYEVFLKDYQTEGKTVDDVKADLLLFKPDAVFISITNATIFSDLEFVNEIRELRDFRVVLKGAIFFDAEERLLNTLDLSNIDVLIGGESNFVILPVIDFLLKGKGSLDSIGGIIYSENGELRKTAFNCWETDLDSLPFPARDLMNNALYQRPDTGEPMATIQVSAGCPSSCIYCLTPIISGKRVRMRSVENVFAEIEECYYKYNIKSFFFKADTFTINKDWAIALCDKIINSPLYGNISFTVNSRTTTLSNVLCQKLKLAGCFMLAIGFESGSDETLKKIKKGATVADSINAARMAREAGLPVFGFFMIGFPWETEEDIKRTLEFALELKLSYVELHIAMPYYGTGLYDYCREYGTLNDTSYGFDVVNPNTKGTAYVSMERINQLKRSFLLRFYLRPSFVADKALDCIKHPSEIKNYAFYAFRLLKNIKRLNK